MKILNLYAGIGGNRTLWGDNHDITAVEINAEIAGIYKSKFTNDNVVTITKSLILYGVVHHVLVTPNCVIAKKQNNILI